MDLYNKQLPTKESLYSFHAFLFPFEWSYLDSQSLLFEEQTDLHTIERLMDKFQAKWERRATWLSPESLLQFNEVVYFYEFVRPVLYDSGKPDSLQRHYYYRLPGGEGENEYVIELADGTTYRLEIDDIVISFFNTGVGVLAFHLFNKRQDQSAPEDILRINALGRRIYPPYFSSKTELIGQQAFFEDADWDRGLNNTKKWKQLAKSIRLETNGAHWAKDDFTSWLTDQRPEREPELVQQLLPPSLRQQIRLSPVLDDRMFTICWYGNKSLVDSIKGKKPEEVYKTHSWWFQFVFVDMGGPGCANQEMMTKLQEDATDARWAGSGTFYGISRYSFVALTDHFSESDFAKVICSHVQTMYYKISLLGLVQRACLLKFSQEVSAISKMEKNERQLAPRVSSLYKQYLRFVNKIYFREVTAQEQGIELYDILQNQMRLDKHVKDLDQEIQELHQYVSMLEEENRNNKLDILTYIGAFFVVPSFIGTYFGIADFKMEAHWWEISLLAFLSSAFAFGVIRTNGTWRCVFITLLILLMTFTLFIYPKLVF